MKSTLDHFIIERKLGKGVSGVVKLGTDSTTGQQFAIKIIKSKSPATAAQFRDMVANEVQSLQQISAPNIVNLAGTNEAGTYTRKQGKGTYICQYIVMELCPNGELFDVLFETGRFQEKIARGLFRQLIAGISACHSAGITHRDLKPENVLFDANFNLKIADFGFSVVACGRDGSGLLHTYRGTEAYMAPEILARRPYNGISVDLFAAGIILFIMMSQNPPFSRASPTDPYYSQIANANPKFWDVHSRNKPADCFSKDFRSLIQSMLALDPAQRLSIAEIQTHAWFNGPCASLEEIYSELSGRKVRMAETAARAQAQKEARARALASRGQVSGAVRHFKDALNIDDYDILNSHDSSVTLSASYNIPTLERKCGVYDANSWKYSQILSPLEAEELFFFVQDFLNEKAADVETSSDYYKLNSKLTTDSEELEVEIKILRGDDLCCLDLDKLSGSHFDMMELFKEMAAKLDEYTEATFEGFN